MFAGIENLSDQSFQTKITMISLNFKKTADGLLPAIVQDHLKSKS